MDIFKALTEAQSAHKVTADLEGRSFGCSLAVVSDVEDPLKIGRVRAMLASKGAKTQTDWLFRLTPSKLVSVCLVDVGDTVVVSFINGDPNSGVYLGVLNNKPQPVGHPEHLESVNVSSKVTQEPEAITITVGDNTVKLTKDFISLDTGQSSLKLTNSTLVIDVSSASVNANSFKVNGKDVMLVGGQDNQGHIMTLSGI